MQTLQEALQFVSERIEAQANRMGDPLRDHERLLLENLPRRPVPGEGFVSPDDVVAPLPRNFEYEKLCAMAKAAVREDTRVDSRSAADWELAAAICKLGRHPMAWLLDRAGVRVSPPHWDRWLLVAVSLLLCGGMVALFGFVADGPSPERWIAAGTIYVSILVAIYVVARRLEEWQLKQFIDTRSHEVRSG